MAMLDHNPHQPSRHAREIIEAIGKIASTHPHCEIEYHAPQPGIHHLILTPAKGGAILRVFAGQGEWVVFSQNWDVVSTDADLIAAIERSLLLQPT